MSDRIFDTVEFIEFAVGEALVARSIELSHYQGLGPPELCSLEKVFRRSVPLLAHDSLHTGYYHWVSGVDMSTAAGVAGYFGELVRLQEEETFTLGGQWHITRGTFSAWCPLSRTDLRVVLSIPGSIETYAIGRDGQRIEASEELWQEAHVAGVLRALSTAPFASLKKIPVPPQVLDEHEMLQFIIDRFLGGTPTTDMRLSAQFLPHEVVEIRSTLANHFFDFCRYSQAAEFFSVLAQVDALFVVPLVKGLRELDAEADAEQIVIKALAEHPTLVQLRNVQSDIATSHGQLQLALEHARAAVQMDTSNCEGWFKLIHVYVRAANHELALIALNVVPIQPEQVPRKVLGVPKTAAGRSEPKMRLRPEADQEAWSDEEDGLEPDPEQDKTGLVDELEDMPAARLGDELEAYRVLVKVYTAVGWDRLLEIRSQVFVMQEDVDGQPDAADTEELVDRPSESEAVTDELRTSESSVGVGSGNGMPAEGPPEPAPAALPHMGDLDQMTGLGDGLSAEDFEMMNELTANPPEAMLAALSAMQEQETAKDAQDTSMRDSGGRSPSLKWAPPTPEDSPEVPQVSMWDSRAVSDEGIRDRSSTFSRQLEFESYEDSPSVPAADISSDEGSDSELQMAATTSATAEEEPDIPALCPRVKADSRNPRAFPIQVFDSSAAQAEDAIEPNRERSSTFGRQLQQWSTADEASLESSFSARLQLESQLHEEPKVAAPNSLLEQKAHARAFASKLQQQGMSMDESGSSSGVDSSFAQRLQQGTEALLQQNAPGAELDDEIIQDVLRAQHEAHSSDESDEFDQRELPSDSLSPDQLRESPAAQLPMDQDTKRLCCGWMDGLFRALYADVRTFAQWMIEDEQAREIGQMHGKQRTRSDWLKLGLLAERMGQLQEAETAYRCCVRLRFDPTVWERLMQLYATARYVSEPLVCATQLSNYHLLRLGKSVDKKRELPPFEVMKVMCGLVASHGLTQVKATMQSAVASGGCPKVMDNMIEFIVKHKCHGYLGNA